MRAIMRVVLGSSVALGGAAFAEESRGYLSHPNHERGLSAQTAFRSDLLENVNLFNGNLVLTVPVSPSFPVGAGFSYGLTLVYNSQLWDYEALGELCDPDGPGAQERPEANPGSAA